MNISEGLKSLIESSQIDGRLSKKEREVIINKAENEGHNRDEFEIYLEGKFQLIKSESVFKKIFKWVLKNKKTSFFVLIGLFVAFYAFTFKSTADIRGCENVDDCIAKNLFDEARSYNHETSQNNLWNEITGNRNWNVDENNKKITNAQINYFLINKAYQQAYVLIADYHFEYDEDSGYNQYNPETQWFNDILERIIFECDNNQELLRKVINLYRPIKIKDEKLSEKYKIVSFMDNSRQKELMKKYKL